MTFANHLHRLIICFLISFLGELQRQKEFEVAMFMYRTGEQQNAYNAMNSTKTLGSFLFITASSSVVLRLLKKCKSLKSSLAQRNFFRVISICVHYSNYSSVGAAVQVFVTSLSTLYNQGSQKRLRIENYSPKNVQCWNHTPHACYYSGPSLRHMLVDGLICFVIFFLSQGLPFDF